MSHVIRTPFGPVCSACQSPLAPEEDDWDECDTCGGEGIGCEEIEDDIYPETLPAPLTAWRAAPPT